MSAVEATASLPHPLAPATLEQREYGRLQMQLQDVHSPCPSLLRRGDDNVLPLLISGDQIVWVPGFRVGQPYLVRSETRQIIRLVFRKG